MTEILEVILSCDLKKLKSLVERGLDINCQIPGTEGCTPLHIAVGIKKLEKKEKILSYLLEMGADPNARSFDDLTPVHIASMWNNCFQLEKLLQNGGNPWLTDNENKNSFDMAADYKAYEAYQILQIYLAEDRFTYKDSNNASKRKSKSRIRHEVVKREDDELVHQSLNEMTNINYITANDNFMSQISAIEDETESFIINLSKFLKRRGSCREKNKSTNLDKSKPKNDTSHNNLFVPLSNATKPPVPKQEQDCHERDFNQAYYFSPHENDSFDSTINNLHVSDTAGPHTIVDSDNETGIVLVAEDVSENCGIDGSANSSMSSTCSDWKTFQADNISRVSAAGSDCSSHPSSSILITSHLQKYSNSKIFDQLQNLGDKPGPVLDHTREVYLRRLAKLRSGCNVSCVLPEPKFCPEIYLFLEGKLNMTRIQNMEHLMAAEFNDLNPDQKWREGNQRSCFNYFLLDPRVTQNLPSRASQLSLEKSFMTFIDSLFYVGKGSRNRPYTHLLEAVKTMQNNDEKSDKIAHILDIWSSGLGVISLHCFHNSIPVEAYTKEACIIEAMGLSNLTNVKTGDYYGISTKWTKSRKRQIGISLLNRALQIFILEGERQIKPKDVKTVK
ncbi:ankyrin repeat and LEM domain-containing protein 1-like [Uloborus diversus]|uniref:ankyrin repeat and LEM domain-containing protein 1-like n=1 Tax=Uloborus diversus TaxID=327109 RepID=UPI0024098314|nr:ankyrin repeat and LEM domain-containing protein 1-like [Uloborus diversus]